MGDEARGMMDSGAELIWTVDANSHLEAMTKYYEFMDWGAYKSEFVQDKNRYPNDWIETQK